MNKISPSGFSSIVVRPQSSNSVANSNRTISFKESAQRPVVKLFNKIPINKRETHVNRSDSFQSKLIRFINTDEYKTYDTKYSKTLIVTSVISSVMTLFLSIYVLYYFSKGISQVYILDEIYDSSLRKKNEDIAPLNVVSKVNTYVTGVMGLVSLVASVLQFRYVYKHNDFRKS